MNEKEIDRVCAELANCLVDKQGLMSPDIVMSWLSGQLPSRQYTKPYTPPGPLSFENQRQAMRVKEEPTSGAKRARPEDAADGKKVKFYDAVHHITTGETTTSSSMSSDGTKTTETTDVGSDTFTQLQEACHASIPLATQILTNHIFGSDPPQPTLTSTLVRLFTIVLFEPIRIVLDVQFARPVNTDVELALARAIESMSSSTLEQKLDSDRLLQTYMASFTLHWFSGVVELGISHRFLSVEALALCQTLLRNHTQLFRPDECRVDAVETYLSGFRFNARIAKHIDRGRLIGAFCKTLVQSTGSAHAEFARNMCYVGIDRTLIKASTIAQTPTGSQFATYATVVKSYKTARHMLESMELEEVAPVPEPLTSDELYDSIIAKIRARHQTQ